MTITYDAKRAYHNRRGLGNYSRDLIRLMTQFAPENTYNLLNPSVKNSIALPYATDINEITPSGLWQCIPSLWRSFGCINSIKELHTDIYHGLSGELPYGIHKPGCRKIVTIHDAIFMRNPQQYSATYRQTFLQKCRYACRAADTIVAISEQTKRDCIRYFGADEQKIQVIYQGCNNRFRKTVSPEERKQVLQQYDLPEQYLLYIGAIEPNKNICNLIRALHHAKIDLPLLIVSLPSKYAENITALAKELKVKTEIRYNIPFTDFPAIYQQAHAFALMSYFEGFGIPVLEAVCSHTPVIAASGSCLEETGGDAALYAKPDDIENIAEQLKLVINDQTTRNRLIKASDAQAAKFTDQAIADRLLQLYQQ